ncbi:MAG: hypothetical protein IJG70_04865 [Kiritimatiellae bacterium]|nr:hypothetical protein [Kiritimatiellia bacterium]
MKTPMTLMVAAAAMVACASEQPVSPLKAAAEKRAAFEAAEGGVFRRARVVACDAADENARFDAPGATGSWSIMLPYSQDERVRFVDATFKNGKFVAGELKTFGRKPEKIDAKRFEALRREFPMIAVKREACLYPALSTPEKLDCGSGDDPKVDVVSSCLGALGGALARFGMVRALAYDVVLFAANGERYGLGRFSEDTIKSSDVYRALKAAVEAAKPELKGAFSERRARDLWRNGKLGYQGTR